VDGLDLTACWSGGRLPERVLFGEADHNNVVDGKPVIDIKRMVRRGKQKLHLDRHTARAQLFDLGQDPGEQRDLCASSPAVAQTLREVLARFEAGELSPEESGKPLSADELELLRTLGYAGEDGPK
jgi:hypothetical protein